MTREELINNICPSVNINDCNGCDACFGCDDCAKELNKLLDEYDKQIRTDAIDEFRTMAIGWNKISSKRIQIVAIDKIAEQLKERKCLH